MALNDELLDALTRHEIYLRRYSNATLRKVLALLKRSDTRLVERLLRDDVSALSRTRMEKLLSDLRRVMETAYVDATGALQVDLEALAVYEGEFQTDLFKRVLPVKFETVTPAANQVIAAVNSRPFQGRLLKDVYPELTQSAWRQVRNTIRGGFIEGRTTDQIVRDLRGTSAQGYKDGVLAKNRRDVETVVRTAVNHTSNTAREYTYEENADLVKGVRWNSTLDGRTSLICASRDGKVYEPGKGPRPPAHYNCLTGDCLITASPGITGASKRWFDGEVIRIKTAGNREITCTPNHPILTRRGWVAAGDLDFTDEVVCHAGAHGAVAVNALDEDEHPAISDVAETFFASSGVKSMPVPLTAPDFHGDGAGSKVAVIGAYRGLSVEGDARTGKKPLKERFVVGGSLASARGFLCSLGSACLAASCRVMGGLGELGNFFGRGTVHSGLLLLGAVSRFSPVGFEQFGYRGWGATKSISDSPNADPVVKKGDCSFSVNMRDSSLMLRGSLDPLGLERPEDDALADAALAGHIISGEAFRVEFDSVINLGRVSFSGHVYNLETVDGYYVSNDIVTHNCRSSTSPVMKSWRELGFDLDELPPATRASMNGQVPADQDYDGWLRKQPKGFQDEVLGSRKAELFRAGLKMDRFVDKSGAELTLDQLRRREREVWERTE